MSYLAVVLINGGSMNIELDTVNKVVKIIDFTATITELLEALDKLGLNYKEWSIQSNTNYTYYPNYPYQSPLEDPIPWRTPPVITYGEYGTITCNHVKGPDNG